MPTRLCLFLCISALALRADVVDLAQSIDASRVDRLDREATYDVWLAGMPPVAGTLTISAHATEKGDHVVEAHLQMPDDAMGTLRIAEYLTLDAKLRPVRYVRDMSGGNGVKTVQLSHLEATWDEGGAKVSGGAARLATAVLPDAILPHWIALVPLDPANRYRLEVLSHTDGPHAAAAMLSCEGTAGGATLWAMRLTHEDPTSEWKWWVDAEAVACFRSGAFEGVRRGTARDALPLDRELSPRMSVRITPDDVKQTAQLKQFTFEDATYRRGAIVALRTQYTGEDSGHGRVMDLSQGNRVVALLRHFELGNPTQRGDECSYTLAVSLPSLEVGKTYDFKTQAEATLHYGAMGTGQVEMIARNDHAAGSVKVISAEGPSIELEIDITFEHASFTGATLGECRIEVKGTVEAMLGN